MTREEELKKLEEISNFLCNMTDDEFFEYFYEGSPSFKRDFDALMSNSLGSGNENSVVLSGNAEYQTPYEDKGYSDFEENTYLLTAAEDAECPTAA